METQICRGRQNPSIHQIQPGLKNEHAKKAETAMLKMITDIDKQTDKNDWSTQLAEHEETRQGSMDIDDDRVQPKAEPC